MLWLIRNDNNSSRPADHTIDGQRQPEESIKGYWPSVKLVLKKYNFNMFFFLPDFSCYKLFSLLSLCREGTLLLCIFCNFHGIALWALRIYLASRFPNLFYTIFSFAMFYFSNIGIHPPSQTAEVKMLKKMWASHWCCHTLRPFELWAGICSERKRLMTSQHQIINWIPTNIFLSSQLCLEGSRYIKILR